MDTQRLLGIAGSLRRGSVNRSLLVAAQELAPEGVEIEILDGLRMIPPYSEDDEPARTPAEVIDLRQRITAADALLIATPEYNGSIPGQLKNALDWASRPRSGREAAAVMGASPGRGGARRAQEDLRKVLEACRARVLEAEFPVGLAGKKFSNEGVLIDDEVREALATYLFGRATRAARVQSGRRPCSSSYNRAPSLPSGALHPGLASAVVSAADAGAAAVQRRGLHNGGLCAVQ